jgi:hypothetical protein
VTFFFDKIKFSCPAAVWLFCCAAMLCTSANADLRAPAWYDEGAAVADWHYRVPITIPASAAQGSTVSLDVDFAALLSAMNIDVASVNFDLNSPRVVGNAGVLVAEQEFVDRIFNNQLDATNNNRGQVRFILADAAASAEYFLYFDITENGAKPANPALVLNGHFELSSGATPTRWTTSAANAGGNQNNEVQTTSLGQTLALGSGCGTGGAGSLNVSPNNIGGNATGQRWHLLGYRDRCEDGSGNEQIRLSRSITVPSGGAAGVLEFYFQVQSFDGISNASNFDWIEFSVNGSTINHRNLGIDNSTSPALRIDTARLGRNGYGGTVADFGWKRAQLDLSTYAGTTINFRVQSRHSSSDNSYRTWVKLDDFVWSLQSATLGTVEAFGVNVTLPNDTASATVSEYQINDVLAIAAQVDVDAAAVLADIYDSDDTLVASSIVLFDDGSHGDVSAGDRIWTNDGSIPADPTYTFTSGPFGSGWRASVYALDGSVAAGGVLDGLLLIPGAATAPQNQANFYNVDEQLFVLRGAAVAIDKSLQTLQDMISAAEPKSIPGAWIRYQVRVENQGPDGINANTIAIVDAIPTELSLCVTASCTCVGTGCSQVDPVHFDESSSPISTGLTFDYTTQVEYSTDGVNYTYTPMPDGEGFDSNIRYVRVRPTGAMNQPSSGSNAEFELRYVVRLE